jgi:hypothetical protein
VDESETRVRDEHGTDEDAADRMREAHESDSREGDEIEARRVEDGCGRRRGGRRLRRAPGRGGATLDTRLLRHLSQQTTPANTHASVRDSSANSGRGARDAGIGRLKALASAKRCKQASEGHDSDSGNKENRIDAPLVLRRWGSELFLLILSDSLTSIDSLRINS